MKTATMTIRDFIKWADAGTVERAVWADLKLFEAGLIDGWGKFMPGVTADTRIIIRKF